MGCKKAAAANCETVFSPAGKFTEEAKNIGDKLLERMIKLHFNWKYEFLPPTVEQVMARYKQKWAGAFAAAAAAAAKETAGPSSSAAAAE